MRPRNKYEKRVAELNATLSQDIAVKDIDWFKKASKSWDFGTGHFCYFTIYTDIQGFEVKRLYRGYKFTDKNVDHFFFVEIIRSFFDGDRKLFFAKQRQMGSYYDCFTFSSEIELRGVYKNYANYDISDLFSLSCASRSQSTGKRVKCVSVSPKELARVICNNPVAENLYKENDWLFGWLLFENYPKQVCRAITLAKRHGFKFNKDNAALWFDMVRAIIYCNKDWHNPVYIAPKDLQATHDKFIDMMHRLRDRKREQKRRRAEQLRIEQETEALKKELEENMAKNEAYIKRRKRFYDMVLSDGMIECRVLRDIKDFEEEGRVMEHCVYRCKYFDKPYSLILSARIGNKRIETIEVDLSHYTIKQCYGKRDHFTMHHQRIVDLVKSQMDIIKTFNRNRRSTKIKIAV